MKNILLLSLSLTIFTSQVQCISLTEYIQRNGIPKTTNAELDLSNKDLTDISGLKDIPDIERIITLDLSNNKLQALPSDIFSTLTNLNQICLSNNQLQTLPSDIFNGIPELSMIDINHNQINELPDDI